MKRVLPTTAAFTAIAFAIAGTASATCTGDTCLNDGNSTNTENPVNPTGGFTDVSTRLRGGQALIAGTKATGKGQFVKTLSETEKDGTFELKSDIYAHRKCDTEACGSAGASLTGHANDRMDTWGYSGAESSGPGPQSALSGVENYAIGEQVLDGHVAVFYGQTDD